MKTLNISISELEYEKFNFKTDKYSFSDLVDMISRELARQNLRKATELSEQAGLSKMSMEEIINEIKSVRKDEDNS
ncbi:MAG: hypothetical protein JST23_05175 [Bacteroidetes bacterium]|nr:hypothetical protein [Bacteroidota bacterium]